MRRIIVALVLFALACALSGCPVFTRGGDERPTAAEE